MYLKASKTNVWPFMKGMLVMLFFLSVSFQATAQDGKELFVNKCASCHAKTSDRLVGPGLAESTTKYTQDWLRKWVKDSKAMIDAGDAQAVAVYEEFNKVPMIPFPSLTDAEIDAIFAYVDASNGGGATTTATTPTATPSAPSNNATAAPGLTFSWRVFSYVFVFLVLLGLIYVGRVELKVRGRMVEEDKIPWGHEKAPITTLVVMITVALAVTAAIIDGVWNGSAMMSYMLYAALPYAAIVIFLIGTIYRYKNRGFQVSSLSSQFLESKTLFWGVQPFHWGILVLFFGHLIAFLFPRSILLWNGSPVRLMILEVSAFVFALSALVGLIILINRRITNPKIKVVSNGMDMMVYTTLLVQIVSGIGIALTCRWGSNWFATVLSPYLVSIVALNPQIDAVAAMPWVVQLHIASAFFIIAIIPFTRFVHFLVAPFNYIWRSYQVVIWNYDRKDIRKSDKHTYGKRTRNH
ncbi:MAG: respiratory nitrate reductase subunit gamma [Aureispira sp.]|nr:respiratory nitrate reductase subunit gamma [Aureispira sp.]